MKKKKFAFLSLMLAFLMALSLVLVACGGGEEDKKPGGNEPGGNEPGGNEPGGNTGDEADVIRGGTTGGGAVALVDESVTRLADKLYVMYTFEDVMSTDTSKNTIVAGYDPYTGEAIRLSGTDSDEYEAYYASGTSPLVSASSMTVPTGGQTAAVEGSESQTVYNVNSNYIRLGAFPDEYFPEITSDYFVDDDETASEVAKGISFSFWAYNYETVEGAAEGSEDGSDWSNVINTDKMSVTWGNITNKDVTGDSYTAIYPKSMATIGRAAYTQSGYELVRQYMTNSQMAAAPSTTVGIVPGDEGSADSPSYYVYNAVSGNIGDPDTDTQYLKDNAADMLGEWRYVTISIDYVDGISFYDNGVLAYNYAPSVFTSGDRWVGDRTSNNGQYDTLLLAMMQGVQGESWGSNFWADLFNGYANIYVDDLIIGAALDASDAEVLYETLSGNELTEEDTQFNSLVTDTDLAEAQMKARENAQTMHANARTNIRNALIATTDDTAFVPVDLGSADLGSADPATFSPTIADVQRAAYDENSNWNWGDGNLITPTETDTGFTFTVEGYSVGKTKEEAGVTVPTDGCYYMLVSLGLWNTATNSGNTCIRPDAFVWQEDENSIQISNYSYAYYENGSSTATANGMPSDWAAWRTLLDVCKVKMTIEYVTETKALTITYELSEPDAGTVYTGTQSYSGGTATGTYTVSDIAYKVVITGTADLTNAALRLYNDHSAFYVTDYEGGTLS